MIDSNSHMELRKFVSLAKGKPPAQIPYYGPGAEPYLTPEYLRTNSIAEMAKASVNSVKVGIGDTIILWDGSNAGEVLRGKAGILASTMTHVSHSGQFDGNYFFYALKSHEPYLKSQTAGSGIPHVDKELLGKIQILNCLPEEQSKIAEILNTVDQVIEQTEAIIGKQQRIKIGLMQDLLTKGIDKHGNIRSEETHEFKDSPLGRIPVEWDVEPAVKLCDAVIDCKNRTPPETQEGHPVIRTPNVRDGEFKYEELLFTGHFSYNIWTARGKPRPGDVVITREAPFGEACLIPNDIPEACLGQRMMMYQANPDLLCNEYLVYTICSERVQAHLLELAGGSTVGHIRVGDIRNLLIPHPKDTKEQQRISDILRAASKSIDDYVNQLSKFISLKTALMQDLLTGDVSVANLLDEQSAI